MIASLPFPQAYQAVLDFHMATDGVVAGPLNLRDPRCSELAIAYLSTKDPCSRLTQHRKGPPLGVVDLNGSRGLYSWGFLPDDPAERNVCLLHLADKVHLNTSGRRKTAADRIDWLLRQVKLPSLRKRTIHVPAEYGANQVGQVKRWVRQGPLWRSV